MRWIWKELAQYVSATTAIEISGISAEELYTILHQDALEHLKWIEAIVFSDEGSNDEKILTLQAWFLEN